MDNSKDEARARLRAKLKNKRENRSRGAGDGHGGVQQRTQGIEQTLMNAFGDNAQMLALAHSIMQSPGTASSFLSSGTASSTSNDTQNTQNTQISPSSFILDDDECEEEGLPPCTDDTVTPKG